MNPVLSWQEHGEHRSAAWRSESRHQPPQRIEAVAQISAEQALSLMHQNTALLWRGDYHQGKQLLAAIKKRVRSHSKPAADFHRHRLQQSQHSRLFNLLLLEVQPGFTLANGRAPDVQAAFILAPAATAKWFRGCGRGAGGRVGAVLWRVVGGCACARPPSSRHR